MRDASPESVSPGTTVVACLVLLSALAYFAFSASVRTILNEWSYLQFVLTSLLHEPHARVFAFDLSPSLEAVTTFAAYAGSCVGVGVLVSRRLAGSQAATPMAWIFGLAAAVVPTLVIALIWWPDGGGHVTNQTVCLAQGVCVAAVWWITRRASHPDSSASNAAHATHQAARAGAEDPLPGWLRAGLALAGVYALTILISGFSGIYGYDSYSDHLARPARWLSLGRLERGLPEEVVEFYPGNFELLVRWTLSLGTDRLAFLLAFGSSAASVWVVFRIARTLGQSRVAATMAALGAASLQALAYQSMIVYSDSYTALCLLLATWLLVVWVREGAKDSASVAGFGLALGLALGAKYSAGPPVIVLGLVWLWHAWRASWDVGSDGLDRLNWGRLATQSVVLGGSALPPMLYWYVRNVVEQGNPLYPLSVAGLPGLNIGALLANVPGPKSALERLTWPWTEIGHISGYETGLGPLVASVVVVAVCAVPFARRRLGGGTLLTWIVLIGASIAWWRTGVLVPRYGFFPFLLS